LRQQEVQDRKTTEKITETKQICFGPTNIGLVVLLSLLGWRSGQENGLGILVKKWLRAKGRKILH